MGPEARSPAYPGTGRGTAGQRAGWPPRRNPAPAAGCHCHHGYCRQFCLVRSRFRDLHQRSQTTDARRQHRQPVAPRRRQRTRGAGDDPGCLACSDAGICVAIQRYRRAWWWQRGETGRHCLVCLGRSYRSSPLPACRFDGDRHPGAPAGGQTGLVRTPGTAQINWA